MRFRFQHKRNLVLVILTILFSCKKNEGSQNVSSILQSHLWYPYKTEIVTTDSLTIQLYDSNFSVYSKKTTILRLDTTINTDTCLLNSTFKFNGNGILDVTNPCNSLYPSYDTTWSVVQNIFLKTISINNPSVQSYYQHHFYFLFPFSYSPPDTTYSFYSNQGKITDINNSQYIFNNEYFTATFGIHYLKMDSLHKLVGKEYTTYRSRN